MRFVLQDLRLALRTLLKDRGFTVVTVLTLAVAIGANTAIFSVVDGVLLRPLPYPDADRIVTVAAGRFPFPGAAPTMTFADRGYRHFIENNTAFESFGGYRFGTGRITLTGAGDPVEVGAAQVSPRAFGVVGTRPERGRFPTEEEAVFGGPRLALLSHRLWVNRFGSDPSIIGRNIELDGRPSLVIGVMPDGYDFPRAGIDVWIPLYLDPQSENIGANTIRAIARLAPGVTIADAVADAERLIARYDEIGYGPAWFANVFDGTAVVQTLQDRIVADARRPLLILLGTMAFVLLIACSNVANLFLVRAEVRTQASAVRMALGSGRGRLVRYVLTESLVLGLVAGAAGVLLAYVGTRMLVSVGPVSIPRLDEISVRGSALLFATGLSVFASLLFGVLPALRSGSDKMLGALRDGGRGSTIGSERHRARSVLAVVQVALALVVVVGSGLMVRSFRELRAVDPGFTAEGLLTFRLAPASIKFTSLESVAQFYDQLIDRLEDIPRVISAGGVNLLPLSGPGSNGGTLIEEFPPPSGESAPRFLMRRATRGYFETMGIPIVEGRSFTTDDHNVRLGSLIISKSIKDLYWPDVSALGKAIRAGAPSTSVGVVGDVHALGMDSPVEEYVYRPMLGGFEPMTMVVRSDADPLSLVPAIRSVIEAMDPDLPVSDIRTMEDVVADSMSRTTFTMSLLLLAAIIALFLGSVGIYGVISYIVGQRTSEIGVRQALGADAKRVRRMVLIHGMKLAGAGVVIGLLAAAAMGRLLSSLLFGVSSFDPLTFVGGSLIFLAVAALAVVIPALRAARIPPAVALQST